MGSCGPGKLGDKLVIDGPFGDACKAHDDNYESPGWTRKQADGQFWIDLRKAAGWNPFYWLWAVTYYSWVRIGGGWAYRRAQAKGKSDG